MSDVKARFKELAELWYEETAVLSNPNKIIQHKAYKEIIEMGWDVVPFILDELEEGPALWGPALRAITGECVTVAAKDQGRIGVVGAAWVKMGEEKGWRKARA